jgi:hypothetical protein
MLPKIEPMKGTTRKGRALVEYRPNEKGPFYKPVDGKQKHFVMIVVRPGPGLPSFSKGSQDVELPTNPLTALGPMDKGSVIIFRATLYRQEPEVQREGCFAVVLVYDMLG